MSPEEARHLLEGPLSKMSFLICTDLPSGSVGIIHGSNFIQSFYEVCFLGHGPRPRRESEKIGSGALP